MREILQFAVFTVFLGGVGGGVCVCGCTACSGEETKRWHRNQGFNLKLHR